MLIKQKDGKYFKNNNTLPTVVKFLKKLNAWGFIKFDMLPARLCS